MELNEKILSLIKFYFNTEDYDLDEEGNFNVRNNGHCLTFTLDNEKDIIFFAIKNLNRCKISGSKTLERLELLARCVGIKYLQLEDQSYINSTYEIDLAFISILAKGESWYNSVGYKQINYDEESLKWDQLRSKKFNDVVKYLEFFTYSQWMEKRFERSGSSGDEWFDDGLYLYSQYIDEEITEDNFLKKLSESIIFVKQSCQDIIEYDIGTASGIIYVGIKDKKLLDESLILPYYLYITLCKYLVTYTRFPLNKELL